MCQISITPIAYIETPFKEKFAIPRQPGIATAAKGKIHFEKDYASADFVRGLEQFSHIWLLFQFHQTVKPAHPPLVRPPRLGGNKKIGVFASRSTHRPNNIGMSVVKLEDVTVNAGIATLHVSGVDLLDQTPIIDIKPYVPYSDALTQAEAGYANHAPDKQMEVVFSKHAQTQLQACTSQYSDLEQLICQVLAQDPRPAYRQNESTDRVYGVRLYALNVQWKVNNNVCHVTDIS